MDHLRLSIPRSASLPTSPDASRTSARQLPFPRDPEALVDAPMTPPLSPHQSEAGDDEKSIVTDSEPDPHHCTPSESRVVSHSSIPVDMEVEPHQVTTPPRPPARLLDDEAAHIEPPGRLKLTDFEVKGTLGTAFGNSGRLRV